MSTAKAGLYIVGDTVQPSNFTRIPNMAIEQLGVYAFKLLAIFMDVARTTSKVWQTNKDLAKKLGCSVNHMKKARTELEAKGYILVDTGTETARAKVTILFTDIWKMNADLYEERNPKPQEGVSPYDTPLSWDDTPLSQHDTLTKQDNITIQENKEEKDSAPDVAVLPVPERLSSADHAAFMEILANQFKLIKNGKGIYDVYHQLRGTGKDKKAKRYKYGGVFREKPVTVDELKTLVPFYRSKIPDLSIPVPTSAEGLETWFGKLRSQTPAQSTPDLHAEWGVTEADYMLPNLEQSPFDLQYPDEKRAG